jgi:ribosomal protein S18 acetylase RimI-like enzyme
MGGPHDQPGPSTHPLIRPATYGDADACARLALEPPGGLHVIVGDPRVRLQVARRTFLARATGFGWERTLVAVEDRRVVGMAARFPDTEWPRLRVRTGVVMLAAAGPRHAVPLIRRARVEERIMAPIPSGRVYVMSLAVVPEHRGRGIGARLLDRVSEEAREKGMQAVALDVAADNERAIRFYRREGFETVSEAHVPASRATPALGALRMERPV